MQILVTGARGKVGAATIHDLIGAGHDVTGCDLAPPVYEAHRPRRALRPGRPDRPRRRVRRRARPGRRHPLRGAPGADPQRAAQGLRQQPAGDVQRRRGVRAHGRRPDRQRLERDRRRHGLRRAAVPCPGRADRRIAPHPAAGPLRAGEALRRAADGRRRRALGRARDLDPAVMGAVGGQLRAQPEPVAERPVRRTAERELLELHRRLRPRARAAAGGRERAGQATRRCTSSRPTTEPDGRCGS